MATRKASVEQSARRCSNSRSMSDVDSASSFTTLPVQQMASSCISAPYTRRRRRLIGSPQTRSEGEANASGVKLAEKAFQVGLVHDQFGRRGSQVFDFVEALKQAHLGDGVLFRAGHFPADSLTPLLDSALADEDA